MKRILLFLAIAASAWAQVSSLPPAAAGASLPATTNLINGDGSGGASNSGIAPSDVATQDYAQGLVSAISIPVQNPGNSIVNCPVRYSGSGLTYNVGACTYYIGGIRYTSAAIDLTSGVADATNTRIDGIIVDNTGTASILAGVAANPALNPTPDQSTQLAITFYSIAANATTPANVTTDNIYDEGSEWTLATTAHFSNSATAPLVGSNSISAAAAVLNNNFTLTKPAAGTVDLATRNILVFKIKASGAWPTGASGATAARFLSIWWLNGSTQEGQQVVVRDGTFGFSSSSTAIQLIAIPTSLFGIAGIPVTTLKYNISGNSGSAALTFKIDSIWLQGGLGAPPLPATVMNFKGTWNAATNYNPNDTVVSGGIGYIALAANTNVAVTTAATWAPTAPNSATESFASFTSQTSVVITHNLNSLDVYPVCYDNGSPRQYIGFNTFQTTSLNTATVTFSTAQSGRCGVLVGGLGASAVGAVASVFGQTGAVPNLSGDCTTSGSSAITCRPGASSTPGTSHTFSGSSDVFICTGTCTLTVPVPALGLQYCAWNDDNVSTVITFAAIGSGARYENQARTAYGTAGTGTLVSAGAIGDLICIYGRDSTHYVLASAHGTLTAN